MSKMKRLIECYVPIYACNMRCDYCYIKQNEHRDFENKIVPFRFSPQHIVKCLSKKRLGGVCLINLCAGGETLLSHEVVELAIGLLKEGHYVMIVNNGTITKHIRELCDIDLEYRKRLWFRFSLHWLELKKLNKINCFFDNVIYAKERGCSIAVEMVASDDYIPYINEIKEICMKKIKSFPEISIARKEKDFSILTKLNREQFNETWRQFGSKSFDFKNQTVGIKRKEFCYAGDWTVTLDLKNGYLSKCYSKTIQKIFDNPKEKIRFEAIGKQCPLPYCHNSHIFMTFGNIPNLDFPTFAEIRDKHCEDGTTWLTQEMHEFIDCKLWENNKKYSRLKRCILNSKFVLGKVALKIRKPLTKIRRRLASWWTQKK